MQSTLPASSESGLGRVDNSTACVEVGAKGKKGKQQSKYTEKIVIKPYILLKNMDQIKQQDVSIVNIQPPRSPHSEVF